MRKMKAVTIVLALVMTMSLLGACSSANNSGSGATASPEASKTPSESAPVASEETTYPENGLPVNEKVVLNIGFFEGGAGREWFDYAMDTFTEKFPNVTFDVTSSPTIDTILGTKIAANNDSDMFDLFTAGSLPGGIAALVKEGKLEPQEDLWDHKAYDGNGKTLKELALNGGFESAPRVSGVTYGLPNSGTSAGLLYSKDLFEKHGWNENPNTWSEFIALLDEIKSADIIPITFPGQVPGYIDNAFGIWKLFEIAEINGTLDTVQGNFRNFKLPIHLSEENIERWNKIYELGKNGYFPEGLAALNHTQSQMQVIQERAAMVVTGTWVENEMKDSTPEGFRWGFMAVPMGDSPDSTKWIRMAQGEGFKIWAAKPELTKKWAKEFNVWLWNLDVQSEIAEKGGLLPVRQDFMDNPEYESKIQSAPKAMFEYTLKNKVMLESGYRNKSLSDPSFAQSNKVLNEAITQIATGKQDPLPILEKAEALLKKAIEAE